MSKNHLLLVSHNPNKQAEISSILTQHGYQVKSLSDIDFHEDIKEDGNSFKENALIKARRLSKEYPLVLADDSGLEIKVLDNQPGVKSARWLGEETPYNIKNQKVLKLMEGETDRRARFVTAMALIKEGQEFMFTGVLEGEIANEALGENGFGYDPIFFVPELQKTLAQLTAAEKNKISHRSQALKQMEEFLNEQN